MNKLNDIVTSCKKVVEKSKHVKINYDRLNEVIEGIDISKISYWLDSNPYNILDMDYKDIINFLLIYHTVGDYCFWGEPKWEIDIEGGKLDGSFAMIYILINRYKNNKDFNLSYEEFSTLVKGNVEIPLLDNRYENLKTMNEILNGRDFYTLIESYTKDEDLFNFIIYNFKYFKDESKYEDFDISFYKRAQLLTSDILHVREKKENIEVIYTNLVGCADYKIPQVMRCFGILEFDDELSHLVDNKIEINEDSIYEVEIRAHDIVVIDYIAKTLDNKISRMDINDYIWLLGQDKKMMTKPYHRTLTSKY